MTVIQDILRNQKNLMAWLIVMVVGTVLALLGPFGIAIVSNAGLLIAVPVAGVCTAVFGAFKFGSALW